MNATDYSNWLIRAFCYCEAALAEKIATPSELCITEELVRSALVRGLGHTRPGEAARLRTEEPAPYSGAACWNGAHAAPSGRPVQHDIKVAAGPNDSGAVVEVKWLKQIKAAELARDFWKLAFARGEVAHGKARRCFLVVGGESKSFSTTLTSLRKAGVDLRWSDAGRQGGTPAPKTVSVDKFWGTSLGRNAFRSFLGWGADGHLRHPPPCSAALKTTCRAKWLRTLPLESGGTTSWRLVLWEIHTHGLANAGGIDWAGTLPNAGMTC